MAHLRDYQEALIGKAREKMRAGVKSILLQAPTGAGKTLLTAHMLKTAAERGMDNFFVVHRKELVRQSMRAFHGEGLHHGIVAAGFAEDYSPPTLICSVQTLARRLKTIKKPRLIVWDECHHIAAGSWTKVYQAFPDAFHIGLTATPWRLDGSGLEDYYKEIIIGPSVRWLIDRGHLSDFKIFAPSNISLAGVHTRMGDFVKSEIADLVDRPTITGSVILHYKKLAFGKRAIVFCASIEHSKHVVEQFNQAGIPACHVDGETDALERDGAIRRFERGDIRILSNVDLFGEGFDVPALEVAILLRPTQSLGLYLQQVGRALRPSHGKTHALILDHVGNVERHGFPDEEREWSLQGRLERRGKAGASTGVRVCQGCFAACRIGADVCPYCGFLFEKQPRTIEEVDGELVELDPAIARRNRLREQSGAKGLEGLVALGKARGYKNPLAWAKHVYRARQAKGRA